MGEPMPVPIWRPRLSIFYFWILSWSKRGEALLVGSPPHQSNFARSAFNFRAAPLHYSVRILSFEPRFEKLSWCKRGGRENPTSVFCENPCVMKASLPPYHFNLGQFIGTNEPALRMDKIG